MISNDHNLTHDSVGLLSDSDPLNTHLGAFCNVVNRGHGHRPKSLDDRRVFFKVWARPARGGYDSWTFQKGAEHSRKKARERLLCISAMEEEVLATYQ